MWFSATALLFAGGSATFAGGLFDLFGLSLLRGFFFFGCFLFLGAHGAFFVGSSATFPRGFFDLFDRFFFSAHGAGFFVGSSTTGAGGRSGNCDTAYQGCHTDAGKDFLQIIFAHFVPP